MAFHADIAGKSLFRERPQAFQCKLPRGKTRDPSRGHPNINLPIPRATR